MVKKEKQESVSVVTLGISAVLVMAYAQNSKQSQRGILGKGTAGRAIEESIYCDDGP
jgi:hypothetical protein